jgi:hypothetical protein
MNGCVALESQRALRDLAQLPRIVEGLTWVGEADLAHDPRPAVLVGLWLKESAEAATVLKRRSDAGAMTILVPRFKAGDLAAVLGAPTSIRVQRFEFQHVTWDDQRTFRVPGVTVIRTSLHSGHWAHTQQELVVLGYSAHQGSAPAVLCMAGLCSRPFGVEVNEQKALLGAIFSKYRVQRLVKAPFTPEVQLAESAEDFVRNHGPLAVPMLLAFAATNGSRKAQDLVTAGWTLGFRLNPVEVAEQLAGLPEVSVDDVTTALTVSGYGGFVRRVKRIMVEEVTQ